MADITDVVLADHVRIRELFTELDSILAGHSTASNLAARRRVWGALAGLLESHADAEEEIFHPAVYRGQPASSRQAAATLADLREAISEARLYPPESDVWLLAVRAARTAAMTHISELESGPLPGWRLSTSPDTRRVLGGLWTEFMAMIPLDRQERSGSA